MGGHSKPPTLLSRHDALAAAEERNDQKPAALPEGWRLFHAADGPEFFHCAQTGETSLQRPSTNARADDNASRNLVCCELGPDALQKIAELHQSGADLNESVSVKLILERAKVTRARVTTVHVRLLSLFASVSF